MAKLLDFPDKGGMTAPEPEARPKAKSSGSRSKSSFEGVDMAGFSVEASRDLAVVVRRIAAFHDEALEAGAIDGSEPKRRFIKRVLAILLDPMLADMEKRGQL